MNKSFFGCTYTDVWASPQNWETTTSKKALNKDWYVQCGFHDPKFPDKEPKGFQFRRKQNKWTTIEDRREAIRIAWEEMETVLKKGYNPITKEFMVPQDAPQTDSILQITRDSNLITALNFANNLHTCNGDTKKDIKSMLAYFSQSCDILKVTNLPINTVRGYHIRQIMDNMVNVKMGFTDKRYNKYIAYLSPLFEILASDGFIDFNPLHKFKKKDTLTEPRETMTIAERIKVNNYLKQHHPRFWLFTILFFHSGGREIELLSLRYEDIDLVNLTYKTIVRKGGKSKWIFRPIKAISVTYWEKALIGAEKENVIFSKGLVPGEKTIRRDQITRRWKTHVKDKLGITADFYALKHANLDEIAERSSLKEAARAAGHTTTAMVEKHYATGHKFREMQQVQQMTNEFAPVEYYSQK